MGALLTEIYGLISKITDQVNRTSGHLAPVPLRWKYAEWPHSEEDLKRTLKYLSSYLHVISTVGVDIEPVVNRTRMQLDAYLDYHGLKLTDPNFLVGLRNENLVEVYTLNHHQIFRNTEFFRISSYDLETLVFVPWQNLFYRHLGVQEEIMKVLNEVVAANKPLWERPPIPSHVLRECYAGHDRAIQYSMKRVGAIIDKELDGVMGYVTILDADELNQGHNVSIL